VDTVNGRLAVGQSETNARMEVSAATATARGLVIRSTDSSPTNPILDVQRGDGGPNLLTLGIRSGPGNTRFGLGVGTSTVNQSGLSTGRMITLNGDVELTGGWNGNTITFYRPSNSNVDVRVVGDRSFTTTDGALWVRTTRGGVLRDALLVDHNRNVSVGTTERGNPSSYGEAVFAIANGVPPTISIDSGVQMYSANTNNVAGKAGLHIRTEDGTRHVLGDRVGVGTINPSALLSEGSGNLFTVNSSGQANASTGGLVTKVNAGVCGDGTFTTATNGLLCIDSANGRLYFRYGDAWHYTAQTAGFQIPNLVWNGRNETEGLKVGDFVIGQLDQRMRDGALHGVYVKFDFDKELSRALAKRPNLITQAIASTGSLSLSDVKDLTVNGSLVVRGSTTFVGSVNFKGTFTVSRQQAGFATIRAGSREVRVEFDQPFSATPVVNATPHGVGDTAWDARQPSKTGFTIRLSGPATQDVTFSWLAIPVQNANTVSSIPQPTDEPVELNEGDPEQTPPVEGESAAHDGQ
jgi:hypothetical protein